MDDTYIVEVWGQTAGIVLKEDGVYRFHAVARPYFALEGTEYEVPGKARLAAARLNRRRQRPADATARPASAADRAPRRTARRSASS